MASKSKRQPEKGKSIWKEKSTSADLRKQSGEGIEIEDSYSDRLETFYQQNSPVNNELIRNAAMNELMGTDINGQIQIVPTEVTVRNKNGKMAPVYSLCSFSYDDDVDLEILNRHGRYKITGYDRRVNNALSTLWLYGRTTVSLTEIFSVMNGYARTNPSKKQLEAVEKALNKLSSIRVYIDLTEEVKANMIEDKDPLIEAGILKNHSDNVKRVVIEDNMIHIRVGTITSEQGKVFKSIQVVSEPTLLMYNRAKGTLISVPMEYIGLDGANATEKTIAFQDYLIMRIIGYKNGKLKENKIKYDTLYRDSGVEKPKLSKDFIRDREMVCRLMEEWKSKGLLADYHEIREGRSYVAIVFEVNDPDDVIEDRKKK